MADKKISQLPAVTTPLGGTEELPAVQSSVTKKVTIAQLQAAPVAAGVANGVQYLNATKTPTTGAELSFDGTTFTVKQNTSAIMRVQAGNDVGDATPAIELMRGADSVFGQNARNDFRIKNSIGILVTESGLNGVVTGLSAMDSAGNYTLYAGNLVIGTSGKGIDFSATAGTGTSELLADYEEGTWTPALTTTTPPTTPFTTDVVFATYTKVGRQVTVTARIRTTNVDIAGADGAAIITGLPFTVVSIGSVVIGNSSAWSTDNPAFGTVSGNNINLNYRATANGATTSLLFSDITTGVSTSNNIFFTATYFV
jgi:hypothetical protein